MKVCIPQTLPPPFSGLRQILQKSPLAYRLARGTFWSGVGTVASRFFALISSIIVARLLGKELFGELGVVNSTVGMFAVFSSLGMGLTAAKHVAEFRTTDPARAARIIKFSTTVAWAAGGILTLALLMFAPWLAKHTLAAPHLTKTLRLAAAWLLFGAITGAQSGILSGLEAFRVISKVACLSGLIAVPLTVLAAWKYGLDGAVIAMVLTQLANVVLNHFALRSEMRRAQIPLHASGACRESQLLWSFSVPAVFSAAMVTPVMWACTAFVVNTPGGYAEMGVFNAANQWRTAIVTIPTLLAGVALPMLSSLRGPEDLNSYRKLLRINLKLSFASAAVAAALVSALAPLIMRSYGAEFGGTHWVLVILCAVSVVWATLNVIGQSLASEGKMWLGFLMNAGWASVLLTLSWLLRFHGALGLAIANLIAYGFHTIVVSSYVVYRMKKL